MLGIKVLSIFFFIYLVFVCDVLGSILFIFLYLILKLISVYGFLFNIWVFY